MNATDRRLRVLHLVLNLRATNSQYNEHSLPVADVRRITLCTFFPPELEPPPSIAVVPGDGTVPGFFRALRRATTADHDVVHAHSAQAAVMLVIAILSRIAPVPLRRTVLTVHDSHHDFKLRNRVLLALAFPFFSRIVFCGHAAAASFPSRWRWLWGNRRRIVNNGADVRRVDRALERVGPVESDVFTVLSIGRLESVKDPWTLLDAYERVHDPGETQLVLVGDGALREEVAAEVARRGLTEAVVMTGLIPRDEVFAWCARADVFVSTSTGEGLPVAAMEAMASRLPVVLSDIPPHREFEVDQRVVPIVAVGDAAGFAAAIDRLRRVGPDERARIGAACRGVIVEGFSLERMTAGYDRVYREGRGGDGGRRPDDGPSA